MQVTRTTIKAWMSSNFGRTPPLTVDRIFFILAGKNYNHNISDEFEFGPDLTRDCRVSCPWPFEKIPIDLGEIGANGHLKRFQGHEELKNKG